MKRAWEIRTEKMTMGDALKKAWAEAKAPAEKLALPALTGSEKQIAWAEDIRKGFIENGFNAEKAIEHFTASFAGERREVRAKKEAFRNEVKAIYVKLAKSFVQKATSSETYIEYRYGLEQALLRNALFLAESYKPEMKEMEISDRYISKMVKDRLCKAILEVNGTQIVASKVNVGGACGIGFATDAESESLSTYVKAFEALADRAVSSEFFGKSKWEVNPLLIGKKAAPIDVYEW